MIIFLAQMFSISVAKKKVCMLEGKKSLSPPLHRLASQPILPYPLGQKGHDDCVRIALSWPQGDGAKKSLKASCLRLHFELKGLMKLVSCFGEHH